MNKLWKFIKDEDGLETSEYAVMGGIIILGLLVAIGFLHNQIEGAFNAIGSSISTSAPTP
jgi:Flp pilus assembly pilin Flp